MDFEWDVDFSWEHFEDNHDCTEQRKHRRFIV